MEALRPKIKFYEKRNFNEKMSATFDFIRINIKPLLKLCLYIMLPLALIQGIFIYSNIFFITPEALDGNIGVLVKPLIFILLAAISSCAIASIVFTSIQVYNEKGSLSEVSIGDIKDKLIRNGLRSLGLSFVIGIILMAFILASSIIIALIPFLGIFILFIGLFVLAFPLMLTFPVFILENSNVIEALSKGIKLGFKTWGSLFTVLFITGILASIIQSVSSLPWTILFIFKQLAYQGETIFFGDSVAMYISSVFMLFVSYVASMIIYIALSYHYSSVSEATEGTSINDDLEIFDQL